MCGRFANYTAPAHMMEEFQIDELLSANEASYNISPGTEISVIVFQDNKKLIRMKWGDEEMELYEVSKDVNSPKNDGPELIMKQKKLF